MKLHLPDIMFHLERKEVLAVRESGMPDLVEAKDRRKRAFAARIVPMMHQAQKFIFDSGSDQDQQTIEAVRETAVAMLEGNLFHLPFPITWIEDPFENPNLRNYYLCVETPVAIDVYVVQRLDTGLPGGLPSAPGMPTYSIFELPLTIHLDEPSDLFTVPIPVAPFVGKNFAEVIYSVKKFIVALNTDQLISEKVPGKKIDPAIDKRWRKYEHTIVRVPLDTSESEGVGGAGEGRGRRKHLVRGYQWGKTTRPLDEQRWIKPHFRGRSELGEVTREHYQVGKVRGTV